MNEVLRSKRFWSMLVGLIFTLIAAVVPALEPHLNTIAPTVVIIITTLIFGYSVEDAMQARK